MTKGARGVMQPTMPPGRKWKWDDGKMHDEPPPSSEMLTPAPLPPKRESETDPAPSTTAAEVDLPPAVPADFAFSDRARLRVQAIDFVIRAASLRRDPVTAAQMIKEAEYLERWLAAPK
jgi:hypothetical protein